MCRGTSAAFKPCRHMSLHWQYQKEKAAFFSFAPRHTWPAWTLSDLTELQVSFHTFSSCLDTPSVFLICWNKHLSNVIKQAVTLHVWVCVCVRVRVCVCRRWVCVGMIHCLLSWAVCHAVLVSAVTGITPICRFRTFNESSIQTWTAAVTIFQVYIFLIPQQQNQHFFTSL